MDDHQQSTGVWSLETHKPAALACLAGAALSATSTIRCPDTHLRYLFAVLCLSFTAGYSILRPGGPDLMKNVRRNQLEVAQLSRTSQNLFIAIATSLAGPSESNWDLLIHDIDSTVSEFPEDLKNDLFMAGEILASSDHLVESLENRSAVSLWIFARADAENIRRTITCLDEASTVLKVGGNISRRLVDAREKSSFNSQTTTPAMPLLSELKI